MNKKGFTLVELLAVIVILAIISLIAIPLIGNVIEKAKIGALESSVNGLVESANMYYANNTIKGETISETTFDFEDGEQVSDKKLEYKGKVYNGKLILHATGEVAVCIDDEEHYAYKNKDTDEIVSGNGTCVYDGTTGDFSSNSSINDLRGKTLAANNISQSENGLNALIKIPEEGHYDKSSIISIPIETIKNVVNLDELALLGKIEVDGENTGSYSITTISGSFTVPSDVSKVFISCMTTNTSVSTSLDTKIYVDDTLITSSYYDTGVIDLHGYVKGRLNEFILDVQEGSIIRIEAAGPTYGGSSIIRATISRIN